MVITLFYYPDWMIGDSCIKPSQSIRNLGVFFDSDNYVYGCTDHKLITNLSRTITFHLRNITRIPRFIDKDTWHHAVRSLVLSRLDYCNGLFLLYQNHTSFAYNVFKIEQRELFLLWTDDMNLHLCWKLSIGFQWNKELLTNYCYMFIKHWMVLHLCLYLIV